MMQKFKSLFQGKRKFVALPLVFILIPTAAYAAFVYLMGITGSVKTASVSPYIASASVVNQTDATCTITKATNGKSVAISITKAFPGGECTFEAVLNDNSVAQDSELKVQGISFVESPNVTTKFVAGKGCGLIANPTIASPSRAHFTVKISPDAPMGQTFPASASAGIEAVPSSSYVAANCQSW